MTELNVEKMQELVKSLPDSEAAEYLDTTVRKAAAGNEYYFGNNVHIVMPLLVALGHRDLERADALIDFGYARHEESYREWILESVHREVGITNRRRVLEAMTREEREAQLVLASLMPADEAERVALVLARLKDDPAHACALAALWWRGSFFEEPLGELADACWQHHSKELRVLLGQWPGTRRRVELLLQWADRLVQLRTNWATHELVLLMELLGDGKYVDRYMLLSVLKQLDGFTEKNRQWILMAMRPLWERVFRNLFRLHEVEGVDAVDVFLRLWAYDSSPESREWLDKLLASREPQERLRDSRQIKRSLKRHGTVGQEFGTAVHASAILHRLGKKLRAYLSRQYVRSDHRRLWRRFLRAERLIQAHSNKALRERLLAEHAAIASETRRARKGAVLKALEIENSEPTLMKHVLLRS